MRHTTSYWRPKVLREDMRVKRLELDLSIVIVSYNTCGVLLACLESIYDSTPRASFEVIVVDNGSTDKTLPELRQRFPEVHIVESGYNAGFTGGNNLGVEQARGRYVLFLNPDTLVLADTLDVLVREADAEAECGALGPSVLNADGSRQTSCWCSPTLLRVLCSVLFLDYLPKWESLTGIKTRYSDPEYEHKMKVGTVSGCCLLAPRRVLVEIGGFDDDYWMYGEEDDLCERIRQKGYKVIYTPAASIVHLGGASLSDHTLRWRLHAERNRRLFFAKHRGRLSLACLRVVLLFDTVRRVVTSTCQMVLTAGTSRRFRLKEGRSLGLLCWQLGFIKQGDRPIAVEEPGYGRALEQRFASEQYGRTSVTQDLRREKPQGKDFVSVCLCTYKRPTLLENALRALQVQETQDRFQYSIVVVDNDRNESARKVVDMLRADSPVEMEYYVEPRRNIARARNRSIEAAQGELIAFIDDDEFPANDWLLRLYETQRRFDADGVLGVVRRHFEQEPPEWLKDPRYSPWCIDRPRTGTVLKAGNTGNALVRKKLFEDDGTRFNPAFGLTGGEDAELFGRLVERGYRLVACRESIVYEVIPPVRCRPRYLLKRRLLEGASAARRFRSLNRSILYRGMWFSKGLVAVVVYSALLPILWIRGTGAAMKYSMKIAYFVGYIAEHLHVQLVRDRSDIES